MDKSVRHGIVSSAAFDYAKRGWKVVPLHSVENGKCTCGKPDCGRSSGKHPRIARWQIFASTDEEKISEWFARWDSLNIGVQMGPESGIIDIETDDADGEILLAKVFGGDIPVTPSFSSGKGTHRLFKYSPDLPNRGTVPFVDPTGKSLLDVKIGADGAGSQSVFPPSMHARGVEYKWLVHPDDCEVSSLSSRAIAWIFNGNDGDDFEADGSIKTRKPKKTKDDWAKIIKGSLEGSRNNNMTSLIGGMLRNTTDLSSPGAVELLLSSARAHNDKNKPPLDDDELINIFKSILKAEQERRTTESASESLTKTPEQRIDEAIKSGIKRPSNMRLVRVEADPVYFELHSDWFSRAPGGFLKLSSAELIDFKPLKRAALDQANYALPKSFAKAWERPGGIYEQLVQSSSTREASLAESLIAQLAEHVLYALSGARQIKDWSEYGKTQNNPVYIESERIWVIRHIDFRADVNHEGFGKGDVVQRFFNAIGIEKKDFRRAPRVVGSRPRMICFNSEHLDRIQGLAHSKADLDKIGQTIKLAPDTAKVAPTGLFSLPNGPTDGLPNDDEPVNLQAVELENGKPDSEQDSFDVDLRANDDGGEV